MAIRVTKHASRVLLERGVRGVTGEPMEIVVHFPTSPAVSARGFEFDSAFPGPELLASARELVRAAAQSPQARLLLFGHADEAGSEVHNKALSDHRAKAMLALLTQDLALFDQVAQEIVYGYSMGGDTAIELADQLTGEYTVDLLITVDVATGGNFGAERVVPRNVRRNVNFWTKNSDTRLGQGGGENTAAAPATIVQNVALHDETHASIYKTTKDKSVELIRRELADARFSPVFKPIMLAFDGCACRLWELS